MDKQCEELESFIRKVFPDDESYKFLMQAMSSNIQSTSVIEIDPHVLEEERLHTKRKILRQMVDLEMP